MAVGWIEGNLSLSEDVFQERLGTLPIRIHWRIAMPKFFDVRGEWDAHQSNGFVVHFFSMTQVLRGSDPAVTNLSGKASHSSGSV